MEAARIFFRVAFKPPATIGLAQATAESAIVSAGGLLASYATFAFMGTDAQVTGEGLRYMWVVFAGMPLYFLFVWLSVLGVMPKTPWRAREASPERCHRSRSRRRRR